jgi:hypothetical protein
MGAFQRLLCGLRGAPAEPGRQGRLPEQGITRAAAGLW